MKQLSMSKQNVLISKQNLHSYVNVDTTTCTANNGRIQTLEAECCVSVVLSYLIKWYIGPSLNKTCIIK
jgi:hypothetical protein